VIASAAGAHLYCCGPTPMRRRSSKRATWPNAKARRVFHRQRKRRPSPAIRGRVATLWQEFVIPAGKASWNVREAGMDRLFLQQGMWACERA
jgi:hypothetical protein